MSELRDSGLAPEVGTRVNSLTLLMRWRLNPGVVWGIAALTAIVIGVSFWKYEGMPSNVLFTAATTLALASACALVMRRVLPVTVVVGAFIAAVNGIAYAKHATLGMVFHAYDIIFYLGSWSTVTYLWFAAPTYIILLLIGILLVAVLLRVAWKIDPTRVSRTAAAGLFSISTIVATSAAVVKPERYHTQFYWDALFISSFYSSWAETLETLWRGQLIESAEAAQMPAFATPGACSPAQKPPHIVLVHQESVVQPNLFPNLDYDKSVDPFFQSADGQIHKMRVETYGGASWLTEFSILTGLSTHSFGGMRPFVQSLLAGKVRDTLPEALTRCGYRNVLFYPMLRNFVSNARFYDAIGLKEIYDLKAQKAPSAQERDRFYYRNALDEMARHIKTSDKPLFTYIQTMSAHWPYDYAYEPEMKVAGGGAGTDPEMHEYLRRLSIAKLDLDELKAELKRRFPNEPVLLVHYGDHQPMATRKMLGFSDNAQAEDVTSDRTDRGFITYYAVEAINHTPPPLPEQQIVDVPYLGSIILQQAGLPLSDPYKERLKLIAKCDGRYHTCANREAILTFHRRLIEAHLIDQR